MTSLPRAPPRYQQRNAVHGRTVMSVKLPNGWTIAQVALAYGLSVNTVYRRWLRGWAVEELGAPLRARGGGGSVDLPERRGLKLGRRAVVGP